jgi:internalin A
VGARSLPIVLVVAMGVGCGGKAGLGIATATDGTRDSGEPESGDVVVKPDATIETPDTRDAKISSCDGVLQFADPRVEATVRQSVGVDAGPLRAEDISLVSELDLDCAFNIGVSSRPEGIVSLDGIECLTQITTIAGNGCVYTDFSPLASLSELKMLAPIDSWGFGVLPAFPHLPALTNVSLGWDAVTDISSLRALPQLEALGLASNDIQDLSPLSGMTRLKSLNLLSNPITDLSALSSLPALASLRLSDTKVVDISALARLPSLASLWLDGTAITNLAPLAGVKTLADLDFSSIRTLDTNAVRSSLDLTTVGLLTQLRKLHLASNAISNLASLSSLVNLESLDLNQNAISDLGPLAGLTHLTHLNLAFNDLLTDVAALGTLGNLQELDLSFDASIKDVSALTALQNLKDLNLSSVLLDCATQGPNLAKLRAQGTIVTSVCPD